MRNFKLFYHHDVFLMVFFFSLLLKHSISSVMTARFLLGLREVQLKPEYGDDDIQLSIFTFDLSTSRTDDSGTGSESQGRTAVAI